MAGTQYALLLALTSEGAGAPDTTGQTVLGPSGPAFSKKRYRALMALIAAEEAAQQRAQEEPAVEEVLQPAISAAEGIVGAAPLLLDDFPDDIESVTRALERAVSATRPVEITQWAERAAEIARQVEIEMYARLEAQEDAANEREVEAFVLATIEDDRAALKRAVEKFLRRVKRGRR